MNVVSVRSCPRNGDVDICMFGEKALSNVSKKACSTVNKKPSGEYDIYIVLMFFSGCWGGNAEKLGITTCFVLR